MQLEDSLQVKQEHISGFAYTTADLDASPRTLLDFGQNILESLSKSKGGITAIIGKDPITNRPVIVDYYRGAPELGEAPMRERVLKAAFNYLERVYNDDCPQTMHIKIDTCGERDVLDTFDSLFLVEELMLNDISIEGMGSFDDNQAVEMTGTFSIMNWERILPIRFTEEAAELLTAPARDIVYGGRRSCGNCGKFNNGCEMLYAIADQAAANDRLLYRVKDATTWSNGGVVTPFAANATAGLDVAGRYLIAISIAAGGHAYALRPTRAGQTATWSALITTGYDAGGAPRALFAKSASKVFIAGAGGFIYRTEVPRASVDTVHDGSLLTDDLNAIHGRGQTVVAVGDANAILVSQNEGDSFGLTDAVPGTVAALTGVWVLNSQQWYVTNAAGELWYTADGGQSWSERSLPTDVTITAVSHIAFSPDSNQIGAIAVVHAGGTDVYRTVTGGRTWFTDQPGIDGDTDTLTVQGIALCGYNQIAVAGTRTGGVTGVIAIAR